MMIFFLKYGHTALDVANKMGYISVIETLKVVTETTITTTHTVTIEEKYRVQAPESMQETFMSDSEDEGGKFPNFQIKLYVMNEISCFFFYVLDFRLLFFIFRHFSLFRE